MECIGVVRCEQKVRKVLQLNRRLVLLVNVVGRPGDHVLQPVGVRTAIAAGVFFTDHKQGVLGPAVVLVMEFTC